ncbi:MAG TPA: hypothetical protein VJA21_21525 [Verrucomicrobiae bacterium]
MEEIPAAPTAEPHQSTNPSIHQSSSAPAAEPHQSTNPSIHQSSSARPPTNPMVQPSPSEASAPAAEPHQSTNPSIHQSSSARPRRRRGKVARLPDRVRHLVNVMLRDGAPYADIIKELANHGYTLNVDNLSRWHSGGFQTWLHEEALLDDQHARLGFANRVVGAKDSRLIQEASIRIAILRMYTLLLDFNPLVLKDRIADNPGAYTRILTALCKLTSGALKLERLRLDQPEN